MSLAKILLCLDTDPQPSVFDAVVAVDAGVDQLLRHGGVTPDAVRDLVYGAMFTRGPADLKNTAVFIGGSDVAAGEKLLAEARECFFGPMRVSRDARLERREHHRGRRRALGAKSTCRSPDATVTVLAATGSVGRRVVRLLAREGAIVRVASRQLARAQQVCDDVRQSRRRRQARRRAKRATTTRSRAAVDGAAVVIAAGAPGVELLPDKLRRECDQLKVAIDLNAVPPAGIGGIQPQDKAAERDGQICYGAIGVGGLKMKLHKAAIRRLFEVNDLVLDAEEIYELGGQFEPRRHKGHKDQI